MKIDIKRLTAMLVVFAMMLPVTGMAEEPAITVEPTIMTEMLSDLQPDNELALTIETEVLTESYGNITADPTQAPLLAFSSTVVDENAGVQPETAGAYKYNNIAELMEAYGLTYEEIAEITGMSEERLNAMTPAELEELAALLALGNIGGGSKTSDSDSTITAAYIIEKYGLTPEMLAEIIGVSVEELDSVPAEVLAEIDALLASGSTGGGSSKPVVTYKSAQELAEAYGITVAQLAKIFDMSVSELETMPEEAYTEMGALLESMEEAYSGVEDIAAYIGVTVAALAEELNITEEELYSMSVVQILALVADMTYEPTYRFQNAYELANWYGMSLNEICMLAGTTVTVIENMTPAQLEELDAMLREMGIVPNYSIKTAQQLAEKYGMTTAELAAYFGISESDLEQLTPELLLEIDLMLQEIGFEPQYKFATAQEVAEKHGLTLAQVAEKTGYTVAELLAMSPDRLEELDKLLSGYEGEDEYKFRSAWELAVYFNLTIEQLAEKADTTVEALESMTPAQLQQIYEKLSSTVPAKGFTIENGVLVSYNGDERNIVIPEGVTKIADRAFEESDIITVKLPGTLTAIGEYAFYNCKSLTEIYIPDSVTGIGTHAFDGCANMVSARLPSKITVVPAYVFNECGKLAQVNIPSGVTEIGDYAFQSARLSKVTLPKNLKKIGEYAFRGNHELDKVVLPEGLESIGTWAFSSCKLTEIIIPDSVTYMGRGVFEYSDLQVCVLSAGMKNIPSHTFAANYDLELVVFPENLQVIEDGAFSNCSKLVLLNLPQGLKRIERHAFWGCSSLELVYIPASVTYIEEEAFMWCEHEKLVLLIPYSRYFVDYCNRNYWMYYFNDRVSYIEYDPDKVQLMVGQKHDPVMYIDFEDVDTITYSSSNKKVATVDANGVITAIAAGTAKITAKSTKGGAKDVITVTVKKAPSSVTLDKKAYEMAVGGTVTLKPTITKNTLTTFTWSSSDTRVAIVDANGKVTAKATGKATITVTTLNGKKASCTVTVRTAPTALKLDATLKMGVKQTYTLKPVIEPEYAFQGLRYVSSDPAVVQVSSAGKLTAKKAGTAVITVTTDNGIAKQMTVTVLAAPAKVKLNATKATMGVGQTGQLVATISPASAYGAPVYSSSNSKVASVDQQGNVTALKAGSATITVKTYNGKKATCRITVRKAPSAISLSDTNLILGVGEGRKITASITKNTTAAITWTSSNEAVVKVSGGQLTPVGIGTATITATTHNGKSASCAVTVKAAPTSVVLDKDSVRLAVKQKAALGVTLMNDGSSDCAGAYTFTTSNKKIATVSSSGVITAVKAGTATITVRTYDEKVYAVCKVTVVPAPSKVVLNKTKATLGVGETLQLKASVSPAASQTVFTYTSSKSSVAMIDSNGIITAVKPGTATITVKAHNGKKATCRITVKPAPVGLTLSAESMTLSVGQAGKLTAALSPNSASAFTIAVSDENIISLSGSKITAMAVGTAVIRVSTFNGIEKTCTVTVTPAQ